MTVRRWPDGRRRWTSKQRRSKVAVLRERDGDLCGICRSPINFILSCRHEHGPTFDHVVRVADGGTDDVSNLQLAHRSCNTRRGQLEERLAMVSDDLDAIALGFLDLGEAGA